jgi:hypothetical protein
MNDIINHWARQVQLSEPPAPGVKGIIGLAGPAGVGKDTFAHVLHRYFSYHMVNARVRSFADPLYEAVSALTGMTVDRLKDRSIKELPFTWKGAPSGIPEWSPRRMLQFIGTEVCRRQITDTFWLDRMRDWRQDNPASVFIHPDVRFENEANMCDLVIELTRDGIIYAGNHPSAMRLPEHRCINMTINLTPDTDYNVLCSDVAKLLAKRNVRP